jgi:hypothetical protein
VLRLARENSGSGYDRIAGALHILGYRISGQTVGNILRRFGIAPAPKHRGRCNSGIIPIAPTHVFTSLGHRVIGNFVGRSRKACFPSAYKCNPGWVKRSRMRAASDRPPPLRTCPPTRSIFLWRTPAAIPAYLDGGHVGRAQCHRSRQLIQRDNVEVVWHSRLRKIRGVRLLAQISQR